MDAQQQAQPDTQKVSSERKQTVTALPKGEDRDTVLNYCYQMVLIRHFEEKAGEMYAKARIGGY